MSAWPHSSFHYASRVYWWDLLSGIRCHKQMSPIALPNSSCRACNRAQEHQDLHIQQVLIMNAACKVISWESNYIITSTFYVSQGPSIAESWELMLSLRKTANHFQTSLKVRYHQSNYIFRQVWPLWSEIGSIISSSSINVVGQFLLIYAKVFSVFVDHSCCHSLSFLIVMTMMMMMMATKMITTMMIMTVIRMISMIMMIEDKMQNPNAIVFSTIHM